MTNWPKDRKYPRIGEFWQWEVCSTHRQGGDDQYQGPRVVYVSHKGFVGSMETEQLLEVTACCLKPTAYPSDDDLRTQEALKARMTPAQLRSAENWAEERFKHVRKLGRKAEFFVKDLQDILVEAYLAGYWQPGPRDISQ